MNDDHASAYVRVYFHLALSNFIPLLDDDYIHPIIHHPTCPATKEKKKLFREPPHHFRFPLSDPFCFSQSS
jgi:hypothetical protein